MIDDYLATFSRRFMMAKINPAATRQMTIRMPHRVGVEILSHRAVGIDTR